MYFQTLDDKRQCVGIYKEGKIYFDTVYNSQKKRIFFALKNSDAESVIRFKEVLQRIIDGKK